MARVLVAGSINMDVVAGAPRHPAPGETLAGTSLAFHPGGKGANQAVAARRAGAETWMVGRLGEDAFGAQLEAFLAAEGLELKHLARLADVPTGTALIVVAESGENSIVVVPGANAALTPDGVEAVEVRAGDILVGQFETPEESTAAFFRRGREAGARTVLNPAPATPVSRELLELTDVLVVNESERDTLLGGASGADPTRALRAHPDQVVVVTLGSRGLEALAGEDVIRLEGHPVECVDTTGAGDCFVGNLAARLALGAELREALAWANRAASLAVQVAGAGPSMPTTEEVEGA